MMSLQPITIGTRTGTVLYLNDLWKPVDPAQATLARVLFDDGGSVTYEVTPIMSTEPTAAASRKSETLLHKAADAYVEKLAEATRYAFMEAKKAINTDQLIIGLASQNHAQVDEAMAAIPDVLAGVLTDVLPNLVWDCLISGADAGVLMLQHSFKTAELRTAFEGKKIGPLRMRFDTTNPKVVDYAKKHIAESIKGITKTTRENIQAAVSDAWDGDLTLREMTKAIIDAVGDEARGELIARTESMAAANAGLLASWNQAVDDGILQEDAQKEWIATETGACPICEELDGETVPLDEVFSSDDDGPPAHPNCRCTMGIAAKSGD